jgi:2-polyprenyl-3-methyl-5-hydroxy-6-metoxy-1,4-benzoquinol methylase
MESNVYENRILNLINEEKNRTCGVSSALEYNKFHSERFQKTLNICIRCIPQKGACVLDIGRSNFTYKLADYYNAVYSLGFDLEKDEGGHREKSFKTKAMNISHVVYDLNFSENINSWPSNLANKFDLIVFAETIEHLYTAPEFSLIMLSFFLKDNGFIIITTPNAVKFFKRIEMLLGINPFEKIRYYSANPGHYREYTKKELINMGKVAGLSLAACYTINFYSSGKRRLITPIELIPSLRNSLVAIFKKSISQRHNESV